MYSKSYYNLLATDNSELTTEELARKRFCEALPDSVVTALTIKAEELRKEVMRLEKQRDEIIDFLNGFNCGDFFDVKEGDAD